ncbi:MAG: SGNH/GDSL hydrolase family protein [Thermodesulfobacteriota bacterium]
MSRFVKTVRILRDGSVILFVTLILLELSLRVFHHVNPTVFFPQDSYNRWRGKPHSIHCGFPLNSKGFNGREFETKKAAGTYRIVVIGDSFVFGVVSQKDVFTYLIEERLRQSGNVEVINMGICSTGPEHYRDLLLREGLELDPDMVIVGFFVGNDFAFGGAEHRSLGLRVADHTFVGSLAVALAHIGPRFDGQIVQDEERCKDYLPSFDLDTYLKIVSERSLIFSRSHSVFNACLRRATACMVETKRICTWRDARMLVVLMPDEVQIDAGLQSAVSERLQRKDLDFGLPNREFGKRLTSEKVEYLDLLEAFRVASAGKRLYKPNDSHWNRAGNAVAADALYDYLRKSPATAESKK